VRSDQGKLAAVEATQSAEIIFVIIGEMILLNVALPSTMALIGLVVIILGMFIHSYHTMLLKKKVH